jgi:GMP synthase-like glutamine amidotransferase
MATCTSACWGSPSPCPVTRCSTDGCRSGRRITTPISSAARRPGSTSRCRGIGQLTDFIRAARGKAKLVGICFGHQAIAQALGGEVVKSDKGWGVGLHDYAVASRQTWMDLAERVSIPASHQDQVVVQPPGTAVTLASAFTPYAGLAWEDGSAISFQFHPEFDPAFAKALIDARRDRLSDPDGAKATLDRPERQCPCRRVDRCVPHRLNALAHSEPSS